VVANSSALLAADRLCAAVQPHSSPVPEDSSWQHDRLTVNGFAIDNRPALSSALWSDRQPYLTDVNNNVRRDECNNEIVHSDLRTHRPSDSPNVVTIASTDGVGTLTNNGVTFSACDIYSSLPDTPAIGLEQDDENAEQTCDVLAGELSDMSIDIDDEDLDGAGLIIYDSRYVVEPSDSISASETNLGATKVVSTRDEG